MSEGDVVFICFVYMPSDDNACRRAMRMLIFFREIRLLPVHYKSNQSRFHIFILDETVQPGDPEGAA